MIVWFIRFADIKVVDNIICDGHHRYIASVLANLPIGVVEGRTTATTDVREWRTVVLDMDDWDTEEQIMILNQLDAQYNHMPVGDLVALLE